MNRVLDKIGIGHHLASPEVLLFDALVYNDNRGQVTELYNASMWPTDLNPVTGMTQANLTASHPGTIRGLHYQVVQPQGKLIRVAEGMIFDVAVDLRKSSPTFGEYSWAILSHDNNRSFWIPRGFAHGFISLTYSQVVYLMDNTRQPEYERCIRFDDPNIDIIWPDEVYRHGEINLDYVKISQRDMEGKSFNDPMYSA